MPPEAPAKPGRKARVSAAADRAVSRAATGKAPDRKLRQGEVMGLDGTIVSRSRASAGFRNEFEVPAHLIPKGFVAQWVRTSCHGKPDQGNYNDHVEQGWQSCVPENVLRHYGTPAGVKHVERDGLVLCMRPEQLNREALAEDRANAVELKQAQAEQFGARKLADGFDGGSLSGDGHFDARRKIRRTVEGTPTELRPKLQHDVDGDD